MLNKKFVFAVSLVAMMAVSNTWATDPASTSSTTDTVETAHSVFTAYTPTEAGSKAGIAGVTYVNRAVNSAGNAAVAAENHAAASGAYAIDAKSAADRANTAAAAAQAAADAAQATASEGVTKANAAQQTADSKVSIAQGTTNAGKGLVVDATSGDLTLTDVATQAELDAVSSVANAAQTAGQVSSAISTAIGNLDGNAEKTGTNDGMYVTAVTQADGKITPSVVAFDTTMSSTSTNAVQNRIVDTELKTKENVSNKVTGDTYTSGDTTKYPSIKTAEAIANTAVAATKSGLESLTERVAANEGDIETLQTGKQDKLTAGTNISIVDNTISSTYTYTLPTATDKTLGGVKVDTAMSSTSTNPVQNKVVYTALSDKLDKTGTAPKATADASGNVITSTYATKTELTNGLATKQNNLGYTAENSTNKVTALSADSTDTQYPSAKLVYTELAKKQNNLTIDSAMSSTSTNPVQNKVVYTALSDKLDKTGTAPKATADASGNVITSTYATKTELTNGLATKQNNLGYTAENSANKVTALSADSTDTQYPSAKLVYTELAKKQNNLTIDSAMSSTSTNPVQNKVVNTALGTKENASNKVTGDTYTSGDTTKYPSIKTAEAIANTAVAATKSGLESLTERVAANEGDIETLQTGKQDKLTAGTNISIVDNTISSTYTYTLPTATASVKGGVTIGSNIGVNSGKISVADATATTKGVSVLGVIPSGGTGSAATGTATIWVE